MAEFKLQKGKKLSVFSLAMINVIAVDSLKTLPTAAKLEFSLLFYFSIAALTFFIPIGLIAAELATAWPQKGGSYVWVKEAFGKRWAFLVVWIQWLYNVAWYPTILSLVAGTLAHVFMPEMLDRPLYMLVSVLSMYWLSTIVNLFGMRVSSLISSVGAIVGTLIPMLLIICLAIKWLYAGKESTIIMSIDNFIPKDFSTGSATYFITIIFGLIGLEMSAIHANDVENPSTDYPKALFISACMILMSLTLSSLAIAVVIPNSELNIITGLIQAFDFFFKEIGMNFMTKLMAIAIAIGGIASVATWTIGPSKGLLVASYDNLRLKPLSRENQHGAPVKVLLVQGIICTMLTALYLVIPAVQGTYWALGAITAQLALIMHIVIFAAGIKLRYSQPNKHRAFKIPLGNFGIIIAASLGILTCIAGICLGFYPPKSIEVGNLISYQLMLLAGILVVCLPVIIITKYDD